MKAGKAPLVSDWFLKECMKIFSEGRLLVGVSDVRRKAILWVIRDMAVNT